MSINEKPIFIRGLSRSGGTLITTILDAHPEIAMSYELYPSLLETAFNSTAEINSFIKILKKENDISNLAKKIKDNNLKKFILRCDRGGLDSKDIESVFIEHLTENNNFDTPQGRLELIAKCCRKKMKREGKLRWGLKCNNKYQDYLSVWPDAYFLNMIRDGRDVLASQLTTGSFKATPESLGISWAATHRAFKKIVDNESTNAYEICYEKLVSKPDEELKRIFIFLGLDYHEKLLDFHNQNLTIYSASSHLSMERISVGIDTSKVNRWKSELTEQQAEEFCDAANGLMSEYGYK